MSEHELSYKPSDQEKELKNIVKDDEDEAIKVIDFNGEKLTTTKIIYNEIDKTARVIEEKYIFNPFTRKFYKVV